MPLPGTTSPAPTLGEPPRLDLHAAYQGNHACGIRGDVTINRHSAADLAAMLRGITAITHLLSTELAEQVSLGGYLRGGLIEAADMLAMRAHTILETANEK